MAVAIYDPTLRRMRGKGYRVVVAFVGGERPPRGNGPLPYSATVWHPLIDANAVVYYGTTELDALRRACDALGIAAR